MLQAPEVAFFFDTDALVQIFIANQQNLLHVLRKDYGVACFIMMEVEIELRSKPKLAGLIRPQLDKALRSGWLKILSSSDLEQLAIFANPGGVSLADIRQLGAEYELDIQTGEAYTHAAAVLLNVPSVSNDLNAIRVLEAKGKQLPPTVLRSFDLFAFFHSEAVLADPEVERIRTTLRSQNEWIPSCMKDVSFVAGVSALKCRLSTSLSIAGGAGGWSQMFYLKRITLGTDETGGITASDSTR